MKIALALALVLTATAAGAQEPEYAWTTVSNGAVHYLNFGGAGGDGRALELLCIGPRATAVTVRVFDTYTGDGPEPRRLTLRSGRSRATVRGHMATADPEPSTFMADAPLASPVFTAFRRTGALSATVGTYVVEGPAPAGAQRQAVEQFFNRCRGR